MPPTLMIYGAYGYTGELCVRRAVEQGLAPVLAGRSRERLEPLAAAHGLPWRAVGLDDPAALDAALEGVDVVLHCAGPFARTSRPMVDACLRRRAHYLDITGEIPVFEACAARDAEARAAGILVMPGVGFDVVPTDCAAAWLKARLPGARALTLAFMGLGGGISHGTLTTMVENLGTPGGAVRRGGRIVPVPRGELTRRIDFGRGPRLAVSIPWGDVSTAWHTTGIPDITVYVAATRGMVLGVRAGDHLGWLLRSRPVQALLKRWVDARPAGPSDAERAGARSLVWGEAVDDAGAVARVRVETPEGYTLTMLSSVAIAQRVLGGDAPPGFHTPAGAYGPDLVTGLPGVTREAL